MGENFLNSKNFNEEIINTDKLVLVDFFATWCGPCKMIGPIISEIADEYKDKVKVYKVDVDKNNDLAIKYNISSIPTLVFFKKGEIIKSLLGYHPKKELEDIINYLI